MSLPELSVRRPVAIFVATVAVALFGYVSSGHLSVELLPDLAYPSLTVQTEYADAAPLSVEQYVTRPIEEAVGVIPGIRSLRSVSRAGISEVVLEFEWSQRMDYAAMEVREKVGLADLPDEAERPRVLRFDPSLDPIRRYAFRGERPLGELRELADRWLKPRIESIKGVAAAKVRGGLDREVQIEADEDRLAAHGLTLDDLSVALRAENVNRPGGQVRDWGAVFLVRTLHEFETLEQVRRTVIREGEGGRVRVEDVADVAFGHRDREEITRFAGEEVVEIALHREGSANTIAVAAAVDERLDEIVDELPEDLSLTLLNDRAGYIEAAIGQVWSAAFVGLLLAVIVLYFFLRDVASTLIVAVTIPVSVIVTFLPMFHLGVELNIMSLGGLALGVGMLVDNSIVVLESIDRHRREGASRRRAAATGASEVAGAVTAATLTTVSVFLPIVFVQGVAGQLFYDLAVTVCLALVASLVFSLTLIPMLAALEFRRLDAIPTGTVLFGNPAAIERSHGRVLRLGPFHFAPPPRRPAGGLRAVLWAIALPLWGLWFVLSAAMRTLIGLLLYAIKIALWLLFAVVRGLWWLLSRLFGVLTWPLRFVIDRLSVAYRPALRGALAARWAVLPIAFGLFALALFSARGLGLELVPDLSQGEFAFRLELPEGTTLASSAEIVERIEQRIGDDPTFARVFSVVGALPSTASGRQTRGENLAQINVVLAGTGGRGGEAAAVESVRAALAAFPQVEAELVRPSVMSVSAPIAVQLFSDSLEALEIAAARLAEEIAAVEGLGDVATTVEPGSPEISIELDRERAGALEIRAADLGQSLRRQIRGEVVGQFREGEERIDIRLRAAEGHRDRSTAVGDLRFRLAGGTTVPLSAVADVNVTRGPAAIHRVGGGRVAEITAQLTDADLGTVLERVRGVLDRTPLPADVVAEIAGQDEELRVSYRSLQLALSLAIFMVFVVMAVQFESLRHPFVILIAVPLGAVGVIAALHLTGTAVSVLALIGAVMLAGIVVNNAIVLVDAINRRRADGQALDAAIVDAGAERLRPILMTTTTTVLALLPMALGLGAGDELRRPLAITVIGGLSVATLLTLIVVPCIYRVISTRLTVAADESLPGATEGGR